VVNKNLPRIKIHDSLNRPGVRKRGTVRRTGVARGVMHCAEGNDCFYLLSRGKKNQTERHREHPGTERSSRGAVDEHIVECGECTGGKKRSYGRSERF